MCGFNNVESRTKVWIGTQVFQRLNQRIFSYVILFGVKFNIIEAILQFSGKSAVMTGEVLMCINDKPRFTDGSALQMCGQALKHFFLGSLS